MSVINIADYRLPMAQASESSINYSVDELTVCLRYLEQSIKAPELSEVKEFIALARMISEDVASANTEANTAQS